MNIPTTPVALAECPVLSPAAQALWDGAAYMEQHGLTTSSWECIATGAVCFYGALRRAVGRGPLWEDGGIEGQAFMALPIAQEAAGLFRARHNTKWPELYISGRSATDVAAAMREAALI